MRPAALIAVLVAAFFAAMPCRAQDTASTAAPAVVARVHKASVWTRGIAWIYIQQRRFHRELTGLMRRLAKDGGLAAAWSLIAASFVYGVLHAAGPGHGKAVLTTYLLSHDAHVARGVWLAGAAALCQGIVAIALVYGLVLAAGLAPRDATAAVIWSERMSFALVALIGVLLSARAARSLLRRRAAGPAHVHAHAHAHDHSDDSGDAACGHGHVHMPSPAQLARATGYRSTLGVVLSIGLRPCSGAVLVLVFANVLALPWAGVGAVLAMSLGTACAVAALAVLAVSARGAATRLAAIGPLGVAGLGDGVAAIGGLVILVIGASLLASSFAPAHPLGL